MKTKLNLCTAAIAIIMLMASGSGCAQTYVPRPYYGTTYTTVPRVYTTQPVVTYDQPVVTYRQPVMTYSQPVVTYSRPVVTYSQPSVTYRTPTYQYRTTYTTAAQPYNQIVQQHAASSMYDANARAAEISRQVERQAAQIESQVKRQVQEFEEKVRRQTEEIERQIARQTAEVSRQVAQSTWHQPSTRVAYIPQNASANSSYARPSRTIYQAGGDAPSCSEAAKKACVNDGDSGESNLDAIFAKVREWGTVATNFLQAAPWWIWVSGVSLLFVVVFLVSIRDARSQPFQTNGDDPWVVDPSGR